jgi:thiamine-monophosphate kinase
VSVGATKAGEFDIIARYFAPLARGFEGAAGLTNDVASFVSAPGCEIVVTVDTLVEGVHFFPEDPPRQIGQKLLRVNLSDLAASGAEPRYYFLAMSLPARIDEDWIAGFTAGLADDQDEFGVRLGGGDTTSTPGPVSLTLTAIGEVPVGATIGRCGAVPDEDIWVSGTVGDAALALPLISAGADMQDYPHILSRYRLPQPRVGLGPALRNLASASIDVSDGLLADLHHICKGSEVGAAIHKVDIPLSDEAKGLLARDSSRWELILGGGDDYEILFTAPTIMRARLDTVSRDSGISLTRIGKTTKGPEIMVSDETGTLRDATISGWRHF